MSPEQYNTFDRDMSRLDPVIAAFAAMHGYTKKRLMRDQPHRALERTLNGVYQFIEIVLEQRGPAGYPDVLVPDTLFAVTTGSVVFDGSRHFRWMVPFDYVVVTFSELLARLPTLLNEAEGVLARCQPAVGCRTFACALSENLGSSSTNSRGQNSGTGDRWPA